MTTGGADLVKPAIIGQCACQITQIETRKRLIPAIECKGNKFSTYSGRIRPIIVGSVQRAEN